MVQPQPLDRSADVDGMPVHYLEWGTQGRQPLVLLHGIARTAHTFDHLAPHFADRFHVIAVDLRGHGDSGWDPQSAYLVEDYVKDVAGLVRDLGLRDIVFWGTRQAGASHRSSRGPHPSWCAP